MVIKNKKIKKQEKLNMNDMNTFWETFDYNNDESNETIDMGEVAKKLAVSGMGRNNLFKFLREKDILMSDNIPYQKYIDAGYFKVAEVLKEIRDEDVYISKTFVTQKGLSYIRMLLLER